MTQCARKDPWIIGRRHQKDFLLGRPGGAQQFKTRTEDGDKNTRTRRNGHQKLKTQEEEEEEEEEEGQQQQEEEGQQQQEQEQQQQQQQQEQEEQQHEEEEQQGNNYQTISEEFAV